MLIGSRKSEDIERVTPNRRCFITDHVGALDDEFLDRMLLADCVLVTIDATTFVQLEEDRVQLVLNALIAFALGVKQIICCCYKVSHTNTLHITMQFSNFLADFC